MVHRMDCGTLNIVGAKVSPTLFMRVDVQPEESMANIMVERVELGGSEAVKSAAGTFNGEYENTPQGSTLSVAALSS